MPKVDYELLAAMERHLDRCYPSGKRLLSHEMFSSGLHVDVLVVPPSTAFPHLRLVTCGMAARPMHVPGGFRWSPYAELTIALPADWPMSHKTFSDPRFRWPFGLLRDLARNTHADGTYLWEGHTSTWGAPGQPFAPDTELSSVLVLAPENVPDGFDEFTCGERTVNILGIYPLHEAELKMVHQDGLDPAVDRLDAAGVTDVVDPCRVSIMG